MPRSPRGNISDISVFCQNVNRSYPHVDTLLQTLKHIDVLFFQEPPRRLIRHTISTVLPDGDPVWGSPRHPDWIPLESKVTGDREARVLTYVHRRLAKLRPALRTDLIDHEDIQVISLHPGGNDVVFLMNVYSDSNRRAIQFLGGKVDSLPHFSYVGGDFNCHSSEWDPACPHHRSPAPALLEHMADIGVYWQRPVNHGPTHTPHNEDLQGSVIDLIFSPMFGNEEFLPILSHDEQGRSDHVPLIMRVPIREVDIRISRMTIDPDSKEELDFCNEVRTKLGEINLDWLDTHEGVEDCAQAIARVFVEGWEHHSAERIITVHSKSWWNTECTEAKLLLAEERSPENISIFRRACSAAKRAFFDNRINDIAVETKQPWDLMSWAGPRKLPLSEAIVHNGWACTDMPSLWEALHSTYNSAADKGV
ncbi:hypothetical protein AGABI2DRAFT_77234, partial [Agaricus bisporus var. bisporus H97]|uniref:hypothetical protein n=1 Tax=Agaricus bisporus var. bisporus (strain H97 / ATCC MYA-4626 / FGSC 10389) TaxID=936046 RepID=UPI00029F69EC